VIRAERRSGTAGGSRLVRPGLAGLIGLIGLVGHGLLHGGVDGRSSAEVCHFGRWMPGLGRSWRTGTGRSAGTWARKTVN